MWTPSRTQGVSKDGTLSTKVGFGGLALKYSAKISKTVKFYQKSVIFDDFWRLFEVHSILAEWQ